MTTAIILGSIGGLIGGTITILIIKYLERKRLNKS